MRFSQCISGVRYPQATNASFFFLLCCLLFWLAIYWFVPVREFIRIYSVIHWIKKPYVERVRNCVCTNPTAAQQTSGNGKNFAVYFIYLLFYGFRHRNFQKSPGAVFNVRPKYHKWFCFIDAALINAYKYIVKSRIDANTNANMMGLPLNYFYLCIKFNAEFWFAVDRCRLLCLHNLFT